MNMGNDDKFAVFILTHGRPDRVITYKTLRRQGYTGPIYIIVDNEDKTIDQYRRNFGEQVIVFDKAAIAQTFDEGDNFQDRRAVIYARNASFEIARELGLDYFLQLDDDYTQFRYKFNAALEYQDQIVLNLDRLFDVVLVFYRAIPSLSIALVQGGDLLGGSQCRDARKLWLKRKAMNTFFCSTRRPFQFFGRINEDVNTYVTLGNRGSLFLSFFSAAVEQITTQNNAGGMTEMYLDSGTYIKSFYTVMYAPSCVMVSGLRSRNTRLHHRISWNNAVPKIVSESHRKLE